MSSILYQSSTTERYRVAGAVALLVAVATAAMIPFATLQLPIVEPFVPIFATTVILVEGLTAFLLMVQFRATAQAYLGGLAGAYGFVLVLAALQLLIFPGVFAKAGLLGAGPQSAVWIWVFWHAGFALLVLLALLLRSRLAAGFTASRMRFMGLGLMLLGPALGAILAYLAIAHGSALPAMIGKVGYAPLRNGPASKIIVGAILLALAACLRITRLRDLLSLWVAVALLASLGDCLLVLVAGARFSLGWYGGRMLNVLSSSVLLCTLLFEFTLAYEKLLSDNNVLQRKVMLDGLTGTFNRVYLLEQFQRELRRAVRERAPMAVVMIDIDHFKQLNDTLGHQTGDACLIAVAGALRAILRRPGDFLARYGGEEFIAVLPRTSEAGAMAIAEAMRQGVIGLDLACDNTGRLLSISLGVASINPAVAEIGLEELVHRADAALYAAKHGGRNQVAVWADPVAAAPLAKPTASA